MRIRNLPTFSPVNSVRPSSLFDELFDMSFPSFSQTLSNMEMYQEGSDLVVRVQAPGFKESEIEISFDNRVLTIQGKSSSEEEKNDERKYYFREITQESFTRSVQLPGTIDEDSIKADYKDGIITVRVQQKSDSAKKVITLNQG